MGAATLFDEYDDFGDLVRVSLARPFAAGSDTSEAAAQRANSSATKNQMLVIIRAVRLAGPAGLTREEIAVRTGIQDKQVDARTVRLGAAGLVMKTTSTRTGRSGRQQEVLVHYRHVGDREVQAWDSPLRRIRRQVNYALWMLQHDNPKGAERELIAAKGE